MESKVFSKRMLNESSENRSSTLFLARFPIFVARSVFISFFIASANASAFGGHKNPVTLFSTVSNGPPL